MDACNVICTDYSCSLAIFSATRYTCTRLSHHYIRQSAFVWITISFPTKLSLRVLSCLQLSRLWTGLDIPGKYYNEGSLGSNVWLEAMKKEEAGGIESHSSVAWHISVQLVREMWAHLRVRLCWALVAWWAENKGDTRTSSIDLAFLWYLST